MEKETEKMVRDTLLPVQVIAWLLSFFLCVYAFLLFIGGIAAFLE